MAVYNIGLDIGSTTIKAAVCDEKRNIIYTHYERHKSNIKEKFVSVLEDISQKTGCIEFNISLSGSSSIGIAEALSLPFVQEVYALRKAIEHFNPDVNVAIELGGEDAKILFMSPVNECRMNSSCAGGTGAFIDQMAELLACDAHTLDILSEDSKKIYTIASRCGVFAKSDIQPLLNQGARREDVADSIFYSIANQTISGLAQGRKIEGNILYIGGPLHFLKNLRRAFDNLLNTEGHMPDNSLFYVSLGAIYSNISTKVYINDLIEKINSSAFRSKKSDIEPLFSSYSEYDKFVKRHEDDNKCVKIIQADDIESGFLGIDAGSTTIKAVLLDSDKNIVDSLYMPSKTGALDIVVNYVKTLYKKYPKLKITSACVTGYGEDIIKNALHIENGIVETMAHYRAVKHFVKDVDFIIDIGGQDIKCFIIRNNAIDSLFLNEACSSGCGSFLSTFASISGHSIEEFSTLALKSKNPCDLGSRCTVFMNSSVKEAQRDGASIEDIAAGLAISVVKNALYKVIRMQKSNIGDNIVVQGGTFMSDAVLRSFEKEVGKNCIRPKIAGLMGAFGCALYAMENVKNSSFITRKEVEDFSAEYTNINCKGCTNSCNLNIITFKDGKKYISGNKCQKPIGVKKRVSLNMYKYKRELLSSYINDKLSTSKKNIGLPLGLNMYELLPFWATFFSEAGFNVVCIPTKKDLFIKSQYSVPSDTVCYPAKLIHGAVLQLCEKKVDYIFYPNMTYNTDEKSSDNNYNCPIVAYYPHLVGINCDFEGVKYFSPFVNISDKGRFSKTFYKVLKKNGIKVAKNIFKKAVESAYSEYQNYIDNIRKTTFEYMLIAKRNAYPVIVLASRPYHIDSLVNHDIDSLITDMGAVVLTEDGFIDNKKSDLRILNQWTYHSRLFRAAEFVANSKTDDINIVQLVSFGCGIDAITQDECRRIVEDSGKIYTSIKIDEQENLGASRIRLRSLFACLEERRKNAR